MTVHYNSPNYLQGIFFKTDTCLLIGILKHRCVSDSLFYVLLTTRAPHALTVRPIFLDLFVAFHRGSVLVLFFCPNTTFYHFLTAQTIQTKFKEAMAEIEEVTKVNGKTCIHYKPRVAENAYIHIVNGSE